MITSWSGRLLVAFSVVLVTFPPAHADAPGVLWQSTSQMVMQGMPFSPPPNTMKICAAKNSNQPPPPPPGQNCTVSNVKRDGDTVTWDSQCTGEMNMSGQGKMTYTGTDAYTGEIKYTADGVNMTVKLSGKKIGECDKPLG
jgi:hypothetical protein